MAKDAKKIEAKKKEGATYKDSLASLAKLQAELKKLSTDMNETFKDVGDDE